MTTLLCSNCDEPIIEGPHPDSLLPDVEEIREGVRRYLEAFFEPPQADPGELERLCNPHTMLDFSAEVLEFIGYAVRHAPQTDDSCGADRRAWFEYCA